MGKAYVRWAATHPDYYQVMFGSELDNTESPEVLTAGERAFADLLDAIVRCQGAGLLPTGDPAGDRRTDLVSAARCLDADDWKRSRPRRHPRGTRATDRAIATRIVVLNSYDNTDLLENDQRCSATGGVASLSRH